MVRRTAYRAAVTVWLTSDLHLGHVLVSGLRRFPSVAAHDATLATRWCERVAPDDTVWVLGDVVMGEWRAGLTLLSSLPGTKHLILGNHDRPHPAYYTTVGDEAAMSHPRQPRPPAPRLPLQGRRMGPVCRGVHDDGAWG